MKMYWSRGGSRSSSGGFERGDAAVARVLELARRARGGDRAATGPARPPRCAVSARRDYGEAASRRRRVLDITYRRSNTGMEVSINMRVFKTIVIAIVLAAMSAEASPLLGFPRQELTASASELKPTIDHYDQRQNGTENYRLKVDGLVFILAPADSLLLAGAGLDPNFSSIFSESDKPKPKPDKEDVKPKPDKEEFTKPKQDKDNIPKSASSVESAVAQKPGLRITSLIAPFLNRIRQQHQQLQSEN